MSVMSPGLSAGYEGWRAGWLRAHVPGDHRAVIAMLHVYSTYIDMWLFMLFVPTLTFA